MVTRFFNWIQNQHDKQDAPFEISKELCLSLHDIIKTSFALLDIFSFYLNNIYVSKITIIQDCILYLREQCFFQSFNQLSLNEIVCKLIHECEVFPEINHVNQKVLDDIFEFTLINLEKYPLLNDLISVENELINCCESIKDLDEIEKSNFRNNVKKLIQYYICAYYKYICDYNLRIERLYYLIDFSFKKIECEFGKKDIFYEIKTYVEMIVKSNLKLVGFTIDKNIVDIQVACAINYKKNRYACWVDSASLLKKKSLKYNSFIKNEEFIRNKNVEKLNSIKDHFSDVLQSRFGISPKTTMHLAY